MAGSEQLNIEWVVKVINEAKAGIDSVIADYKKLGAAAAGAEKAGAPIGGAQQQQRMSGLHTRITQLTTGFRKLGVELETIDLYFISGFKVVGLFKLLDFTKQAILGAEQYNNALRGVAAIARSSGENVEQVFTTINKLAEDGRASIQDLTESMRYLLPKYGLEDTVKLLEALKTTGTGLGTQKQLPLGEAIKRSSQGIAQWISTLADATLVTENLDSMVLKYANSLGVSSDKLSENQKYHAVLLAFMKEAKNVQEAEALAMAGLTGNIAKYNKELTEFKNVFGQTLTPMTTDIVKFLTETTKTLSKFLFTLEKGFLSIGHGAEMMWLRVKAAFSWGNLWKGAKDVIAEQADLMEYMRQQYELSIKELQIKYGVGTNLKGMQTEISANFGNMPPSTTNWWGNRSFTPVEGDVDFPKNMEKLVDNAYKSFNASMTELEEASKAWGTKLANAFSQPLERGISDVFFGIFTGEKGSIIERAKNFGRSLARAISDALTEAIMMPVKSTFSTLFAGIGSSLFGFAGAATGAGAGAVPALSEVRGFDFASAKSSGITINIGSGYTPNEIGSMVAKGVQESYSNNSVVRKVIKGQR